MSGGPLSLHPVARAAGASTQRAAPAGLGFTPPPLPRRGERRDGLGAAQRHAMVGAIVAAHVVGGWALLQIREVREAVAEAAPMFVSLVTPEPPKPLPVPPPPPPPKAPQPVPKKPPPVVIAAPPAPTPEPAPFVVPPLPEVVPPPPPPVAVVVPPAPAPPAPPPAPKIIPASAVQYLGDPPVPEYPRLSIRARETGRVMLRIYIDEAGLPRSVQVEKSSGHPRLDEAGAAAMRKARFKPYTENGQPVAGYAFVPLDFALEN